MLPCTILSRLAPPSSRPILPDPIDADLENLHSPNNRLSTPPPIHFIDAHAFNLQRPGRNSPSTEEIHRGHTVGHEAYAAAAEPPLSADGIPSLMLMWGLVAVGEELANRLAAVEKGEDRWVTGFAIAVAG